MNLKSIPKFVINLKRRPDRLEKIVEELKYVGWEYEIFEAIDTKSYVGCALSHFAIIEIAKERKYSSVMVIEDDCSFMPYAKDLIDKIDESINNLDYAIINLSPSLNRKVNVSSHSKYLLDITNYPPKKDEEGPTFATNMIIYNEKIYDLVLECKNESILRYNAIDQFIYQKIYLNYPSFAPILPLAPQIDDYSDVSHGVYSNFYRQTYNWNGYSPMKIPNEYLNYDENLNKKIKNQHFKISYES
jgi:hypothetical protein